MLCPPARPCQPVSARLPAQCTLQSAFCSRAAVHAALFSEPPLSACAHACACLQGQPRDNARANIYSLGAIGDELLGILSPTVDPDASHSGLRALQRLLTICQSSSPAARPPAHVVAYHLQLVKQLLLSVESPPELISTLASPKVAPLTPCSQLGMTLHLGCYCPGLTRHPDTCLPDRRLPVPLAGWQDHLR